MEQLDISNCSKQDIMEVLMAEGIGGFDDMRISDVDIESEFGITKKDIINVLEKSHSYNDTSKIPNCFLCQQILVNFILNVCLPGRSIFYKNVQFDQIKYQSEQPDEKNSLMYGIIHRYFKLLFTEDQYTYK